MTEKEKRECYESENLIAAKSGDDHCDEPSCPAMRRLNTVAGNSTIVRSTIGLGPNLGLSLTAEGMRDEQI